MTKPIEEYLDELARSLHRDGADHRRLLAETEDHLRQSSEQLASAGLSRDAAEAEAVRRFGPAAALARQARPSRSALFADLIRAAWLVTGIGLVAIGVSGLLAWLIDRTAGTTFLAGDAFGVAYTPARCAEYLEYVPGAASCEAAAAAHHSGEIVFYRLAAGVLGLAVLATYALVAGRLRRRGGVLPHGVTAIVAAALFGVVGLLLSLDALGTWLGESAHHEAAAGVGGSLSAGLVALLVGVVAGVLAITAWRREPAPAAPSSSANGP